MKLQTELTFVKQRFEANLDSIKKYAPQLKESKQYKDFETRLTHDCMHAFVGVGTICDWYDKYGCNDSHVTTLGKKVLKELGII